MAEGDQRVNEGCPGTGLKGLAAPLTTVKWSRNAPSGSRMGVILNAVSAVGRSARLKVCRDLAADGYRSVTRHAAGDGLGRSVVATGRSSSTSCFPEKDSARARSAGASAICTSLGCVRWVGGRPPRRACPGSGAPARYSADTPWPPTEGRDLDDADLDELSPDAGTPAAADENERLVIFASAVAADVAALRCVADALHGAWAEGGLGRNTTEDAEIAADWLPRHWTGARDRRAGCGFRLLRSTMKSARYPGAASVDYVVRPPLAAPLADWALCPADGGPVHAT